MARRKGESQPKSCRNCTCEAFQGASMLAEEVEFGRAVQAWMRKYGVKFPTNSEWLAIAKSLGYRRVAEPGPLPRRPLRKESYDGDD